MIRFAAAVFVCLLWACGPAPQPMPQPAPTPADAWLDQPLPVDVQIRSGTLPNGMRYYIRPNGKPELRAELRLAVNAGSILEDGDQLGLAHFVEHMAFNGTENFARQELVDYLESIGMRFGPDLNAYTSFDETVYMLTIPTDDPEVVHRAFEILRDWAGGILFTGEEIDKERGVVIEEWRGDRGAQARVRDRQLPVILHRSRYAERLPIGEKAVLDTFAHERLRDFYHTWYRPDLMALVAVGDFDPVRLEELVQHYLGAMPAADGPLERPAYEVPDHAEPLFAVAVDPELTRSSLQIYYKRDVEEQQSMRAYRRFILRTLYHGMLNKRLYELSIGDDPPFLGASSGQGFLVRTKEYFSLGAVVGDNGILKGLGALLTEARRAQVHGFTATELEREKKARLRSIEQAYRERDKTESSRYAAEYLRNFFQKEPIPGIEYEHGLYKTFVPKITLDEINAFAHGVVRDSSRVLTVSLPQKEGLEVPQPAELQAVFETVASVEVEPYIDRVKDRPLVAEIPEGGRIVTEEEIAELGAVEWRLDNGVRVVLKSTEFKNDEVLFTAFSPGGHSLVEDVDYIAAYTADGIAQRSGTGEFSAVELQKQLAGKVVSVAPWIGALEEGFSGRASPEDLESLFQLVYLYATQARRDTTAFKAYQTLIRGVIKNRDAAPETAFRDTLRAVLSQNHYRTRPWSEALIGEMDLDTSLRVYRERFADCSDMTFVFVGNFAVEDLRDPVERYLGALPSGPGEKWRDTAIVAPEGVERRTVRKGLEPKGRTQLVFTGPFEWNRQNVYDIHSMADALRIRLREVLREDMGGTYGVGVGVSVSRWPRPEYSVAVGFGADPDRLDELVSQVFAQIEDIKLNGLDETYIAKVKEAQKREHEVRLQENNFWVESLRSAYYHGTDPRRLLRYGELVEGLNAAVVQSATQQYFNTGRYVRVNLLPEE